MKRAILLSLLTILLALKSNAQSNGWTKDYNTKIFNECLASLEKYTNLTDDQKNKIADCYQEEISKTYTYEDYQSKTDYKKNEIQVATLKLCLKSLGVDLKDDKDKALIPTKADLLGHWKNDDDSEISFYDNDTYEIKYANDKKEKGTWKINNNQLTLFKKCFLHKKERPFKITLFTKTGFSYKSSKGKLIALTATKIS